MKTKYYETIDETVVHHKCDNGLDIYCILKPRFNKKFVTYTTKYGSIDDHFIVNGEEVRVPDGIAHFLEHKMFEKEDGDVFQLFSKHGANANAFTSYDRTAYLFSTTHELKKNLKLLMDMVENPYFTDKTVEKEVGIIDEELKMYRDNPGYRLYFETLQLMYHDLPVKKDIGGTSESIKEITKEHLYTCHETFYHPSNMVLFIVGDVDYEDIIQYIETHQNNRGLKSSHEIHRILPDEPRATKNIRNELEMDVGETKAMIGYKGDSTSLSNHEKLIKDMSLMLGLDLVFGEQSNYYYDLQKKGLIDDSFNFYHVEEGTHSFTLISGNTEDVDGFSDAISDIVDEVNSENYFTDEKLTLKKREVIGDYLSSLNSPEYIATQYTKYYMDGIDLYELLEVIDNISNEDIAYYFKTMLDDKYKVLSVVKPHA